MVKTKTKKVVKRARTSSRTIGKKKQKHDIKMPHGKGNGIIIVDGIYYRPTDTKTKKLDGVKHLTHTEFEEFDPESRTEVVNELAELLKDKVPPEEVIKELLKDTKVESLKKTLKKIKSGEIEVKTTRGCLGLTFKDNKKKKSQYVSIMN